MLAFAAIATLLPGTLTSEGAVTSDVESNRALDLQEQRFPPVRVPTKLVVVRSEHSRVGDPAFRAELLALTFSREWRRAVAFEGERIVSRDRHAVLIPIGLAGDPEETVKDVIELLPRDDDPPSFDAAITASSRTRRPGSRSGGRRRCWACSSMRSRSCRAASPVRPPRARRSC